MSDLKVLWVEDQASENRGLIKFVEKSGCIVLQAGTVAEALGVLALGVPDRLIVDLDLPLGPGAAHLPDTKYNGHHIIEHVLRSKLMSPQAIVCVTNFNSDAQRLLANTPVRIVTKWAHMEELTNALHNIS